VDASSGGYSTFLDPAFDPIYPQWSPETNTNNIPGDSPPITSSSSSSPNSVGVNGGSISLPPHIHAQPPPPGPAPLFRIESADDDLGLTCQLGQVGPAATCPCATPRYKVVGASTSSPEGAQTDSEDDLSKDNNNNNNPPSTSSSSATTTFADERRKSSSSAFSKANQSHDHNNNPFWADEETGDVFLHEGFKLQPSKHYFITLQVSGEFNKSKTD